MYNMSVNVFGYKMSIISLLFFAIVIILISHTYSGCCNNPYALIEGYEGGASEEHKRMSSIKKVQKTKKAPKTRSQKVTRKDLLVPIQTMDNPLCMILD